ncbi:hypothetical protein EON67_09385, partial [archaeon]
MREANVARMTFPVCACAVVSAGHAAARVSTAGASCACAVSSRPAVSRIVLSAFCIEHEGIMLPLYSRGIPITVISHYDVDEARPGVASSGLRVFEDGRISAPHGASPPHAHTYPHVDLIYPNMFRHAPGVGGGNFSKFGVMHSKLVLIFFSHKPPGAARCRPAFARLVISSSNLTHVDWDYLAQCAWVQDFVAREARTGPVVSIAPAPPTSEDGHETIDLFVSAPACDGERSLRAWLAEMSVPYATCADLFDTYDVSARAWMADLVCSVPGLHATQLRDAGARGTKIMTARALFHAATLDASKSEASEASSEVCGGEGVGPAAATAHGASAAVAGTKRSRPWEGTAPTGTVASEEPSALQPAQPWVSEWGIVRFSRLRQVHERLPRVVADGHVARRGEDPERHGEVE